MDNPTPTIHTTANDAAASATASQLLERIETVLRQSLDRHDQLVSLMHRKREAFRAADASLMTDLCRLENVQVQAISDLEKSRLALVGELTLKVLPDATEPMKLAELAEHFPEPTRGKLLVLRAQLLERMHAVREQAGVARRASESLLRHVNGLVRTIATVSQGGPAYTSTGRSHQRPASLNTVSFVA